MQKSDSMVDRSSSKSLIGEKELNPQRMAKFLRRSFRRKKTEQEGDEFEPNAIRWRPDGIDALCRSTKFSRREIQHMYRGFKQDCPSGMVCEDTFKGIYSKFFPQGDATHYAHHVFSAFDIQHNGSISFENFLAALSLLARGSREDKLEWAFCLYDVNGDGHITKDEMLTIVKSIYNLMGEFSNPPTQTNTASDHVDRVFAKLDLNKDGVVTMDEFMNVCLNDEVIRRSLDILEAAL